MEPKYIANFVAAEIAHRLRDGRLRAEYASIEQPAGRFITDYTITIDGQEFKFAYGDTPFNTPATKAVIDDKWALYERAGSDLHMPFTRSFANDDAADLEDLTRQILADIESENHPFAFPIVIKPNRGSLSLNVCICHDEDELRKGLALVHGGRKDPRDKILAQQYIGPAREYRAVFFNGSLIFALEKNPDQIAPGLDVTFGRKASPDFWEGSSIGEVEDETLKSRFASLGAYLNTQLGARYAGIDVRVDESGELWLLEANSAPLNLGGVSRYFSNGLSVVEGLTNSMVDEILSMARQLKHERESQPAAEPDSALHALQCA